MRHIRKGTNWGEWLTGLRRERMGEMGEVEDSSTTGITEVLFCLRNE